MQAFVITYEYLMIDLQHFMIMVELNFFWKNVMHSL